jgi:tRNA threonylcarbamoyladenosine biosynthesis protein TsaE
VAPISEDGVLEVTTYSPAQTFQLGRRLGYLLQAGDVICLEGELGSGKTCLVQGIGAGLGVLGPVRSPTFVLINEYPPTCGAITLYHVDLYRIDGAGAVDVGLEEYLYGDGVTVIEWAERAREMMPTERLWVTLSYLDATKRRLVFESVGCHYQEMVNALRREVSTLVDRDA